MPTSLENFPLAVLTDGIISYVQYLFGNPKITPSEYRWNTNDRESRITISGPFVIDNERPNSAPFIVVERTPFTFQNRTIDNLKSAANNTFEDDEKVVIADGGITITIGSQVASEASSIANFLAIQLQADRHGIMTTLGFLRNLKISGISNETPVYKDSEVRRWTVTLNVFASLQMGWKYEYEPGTPWKQLELRAIDNEYKFLSKGSVESGRDIIRDSTADFGFEITDSPQLLRRELEYRWYYIQFEDSSKLYVVEEIVSNNELRLSTVDKDGNKIPYSAEESGIVDYKLLWNSVHLAVNIPTKK